MLKIDTSEYWITGNGDLIKYSSLDEQHARNVYFMLKRQKVEIPKSLISRIEFFNSRRSEIKQLF